MELRVAAVLQGSRNEYSSSWERSSKIWVVLKIRVAFIRVPYYIGDRKGGPNLENCPFSGGFEHRAWCCGAWEVSGWSHLVAAQRPNPAEDRELYATTTPTTSQHLIVQDKVNTI